MTSAEAWLWLFVLMLLSAAGGWCLREARGMFDYWAVPASRLDQFTEGEDRVADRDRP